MFVVVLHIPASPPTPPTAPPVPLTHRPAAPPPSCPSPLPSCRLSTRPPTHPPTHPAVPPVQPNSGGRVPGLPCPRPVDGDVQRWAHEGEVWRVAMQEAAEAGRGGRGKAREGGAGGRRFAGVGHRAGQPAAGRPVGRGSPEGVQAASSLIPRSRRSTSPYCLQMWHCFRACDNNQLIISEMSNQVGARLPTLTCRCGAAWPCDHLQPRQRHAPCAAAPGLACCRRRRRR